MKLSIFSLKKVVFQGEARLLNCKTEAGEITILDNHEPYIGLMTSGAARVVDNRNQEHIFQVLSGFVEVKSGNEVRCIIE